MNFSFTGKKKWTLAFFPSSKFWSLSHPMSFKRPKQTVRHKQKNTRPWKKSNSPWLWEHGSNKSDVNRKQAEIFNMKKQNLPQKMKQQKTHELRAPCLSPHMNIWSLSEVVRCGVGCCKGAVGYSEALSAHQNTAFKFHSVSSSSQSIHVSHSVTSALL